MNYMCHFENTMTLILKTVGRHKKFMKCKCPCHSEESSHAHFQRTKENRVPHLSSHLGLCQSCCPASPTPLSCLTPSHPQRHLLGQGTSQSFSPKPQHQKTLFFVNYKINISTTPMLLAIHAFMSLERERRRREEKESSFGKFPSSRRRQVSNELSAFGAFDLPVGLQ